MLRAKMISREIVETDVTVYAFNVAQERAETLDYTIAGAYTTDEMFLKQIKKEYDTEELLHVKIVSHNEKSSIYEMSEEEFIKHATPISAERYAKRIEARDKQREKRAAGKFNSAD